MNTNEINQRTFGEETTPRILSASESHMACLMLLDTSGSMAGTPIEELNKGLNKFYEDVCKDERTKEILDIAIVEFNSATRVVQPFVPVLYMEPVNLSAGGGTIMAPAIRTAIDMVTERSKFYLQTGTQPYKPWILMISDSLANDDLSQIADEIHGLEENGKLKFFSLGVGDYNSEVFHKLSGPKVMKLKDYDFSSFFDWVNKSMRSVSVTAPGDTPQGVPLPENVDKDTNDWMA